MNPFFFVFLWVFLAPSALSQTPEGLTFHDAWTVPYADNQPREYHIYGIMSNLTPQKDVLLRAETRLGTIVFESLLFAPQNKDKTPTPLATLDVPEEQVMFFDPGRMRLTLKQPIKRLKVGDTFPLTLIFRHAGAVKSTVEVKRCCEEDSGENTTRPADNTPR
ncbi:MAG: copper chaperone PCu(A)C [Alphaproteobacteria bacterium]